MEIDFVAFRYTFTVYIFIGKKTLLFVVIQCKWLFVNKIQTKVFHAIAILIVKIKCIQHIPLTHYFPMSNDFLFYACNI